MGRFGVGRATALLVREAAQSADLLRAEAAYYAWGAADFWGARTGSGVLHEGRDLLGEGWVYWMGVGGSCSVDNPWPVAPDPRGVGHCCNASLARLGASGSQPSWSVDFQVGCGTTGAQTRVQSTGLIAVGARRRRSAQS